MKKLPLWTLAVMLLAGLGLTAVSVQGVEREKPPAFSDLDKDKDGYITADEAMAVPSLAEQLPQLDKNADGRLSKDEYENYVAMTGAAPGTGGAAPKMKVD